jgi:hypothetical protein
MFRGSLACARSHLSTRARVAGTPDNREEREARAAPPAMLRSSLANARSRLSMTAPKKESRRVGTRRLPYVGDRVGGLGVRPPALALKVIAPTYGS